MKPKILFFGIKTFPSRGGTDRVAENLIKNLSEDLDITLFCYRDPQADSYFKNIRIIQFDSILKGSAGSFLYFFRSAIKALLMDFDLVHVHKTDCAFFIPLLMIRHKVIATSHEAPYRRDKWNALQKFYFKVAEPLFIYLPNKVTCISEPLSIYYRNRYKRVVHYIPNGITALSRENYDYKAASAALPAGAKLDQPYIFFSARRLMSTKGCHTMLLALKKIRYQGQIFIAGEGSHHSGYIRELNKIAKGLNVHFLGFVHPVQTVLALADKCRLFIFPSETEGMSIMLLEAASAGRPVIASDIPENRILNDEDLLFFKNKSADDLGEKITFALANMEKMEIMGMSAQKSVSENYSWFNISNTYKELYLQAAAQEIIVSG
jgi:glycosyltransferase involved in cell wall biosynthesis